MTDDEQSAAIMYEGGGDSKRSNQSITHRRKKKRNFSCSPRYFDDKKKAKINSGLLVEPKSSWLRREKGSGRADGRMHIRSVCVFFFFSLYYTSLV
jgi:hypothetical protein